MQKVIVRVPGSTSNLGPGFDCLGVALRIYNSITIAPTPSGEPLPAMVEEAARKFFNRTRLQPFPFSCGLRGNVPLSRGLGSSVTVRLGVLAGLNELARTRLDRPALFQLCAELEGHPDNAAPAIDGGFTVARGTTFQRFEVSPRLRFVLLIPDYEVRTSAARRILPATISRRAAVASCGNACAIAAAFASRNYEHLRGNFVDQLHQPFRRKLNPLLSKTIAAAERAGALGAFLSGSGSTICAITLENPKRVAQAMKRAAGSKSVKTIITRADNRGLQIRNPQSAIRN